MINLKDKVIIVTGGSGLIGRAILKHIIINGGIAINADIDVESSWENRSVQCDITSEKAISDTVEWVIGKAGRIDGLVNNAYPRTQNWGTDFNNFDIESWRKNIDWQLNSYVCFCHSVIEHLKESKGAIINIASIYGVVANDFSIYEDTGLTPPDAYPAIKGGLINFTRFLASRYGKDGIRVNCVSPGGVFDHQNKKLVAAYENKVPMKRMADPADIAPAVSFLLSDEAGYITGQNLIVDGGWTAI